MGTKRNEGKHQSPGGDCALVIIIGADFSRLPLRRKLPSNFLMSSWKSTSSRKFLIGYPAHPTNQSSLLRKGSSEFGRPRSENFDLDMYLALGRLVSLSLLGLSIIRWLNRTSSLSSTGTTGRNLKIQPRFRGREIPVPLRTRLRPSVGIC